MGAIIPDKYWFNLGRGTCMEPARGFAGPTNYYVTRKTVFVFQSANVGLA